MKAMENKQFCKFLENFCNFSLTLEQSLQNGAILVS